MAATTQLDPTGLVDALASAASVLEDHRAALDQLDVGDGWELDDLGDEPTTSPDAGAPRQRAAGSDLAATLRAAADAAAGAPSFARIADALVAGPGSVRTGRAGDDLAQVLAGLAESLRNADRLDASRLAIGLELAAERLTVADDGRHAGCLPAVLAVAADAALAAVDADAELADVLLAAADEGLVELESGPRANPDLVERGVVDAAAAGFLLLLDVLASVVTGEPLPAAPVEPAERRPTGTGHRFRVRCRVEPHDGCGIEEAAWLESTWHELGELVAFDHAGPAWRIELSTVAPGAAIEAILDVGRPRELHVGLDDPRA